MYNNEFNASNPVYGRIDTQEAHTKMIKEALQSCAFAPIYDEFGPNKSDVFAKLSHSDVINTCDFNKFMNICTFLRETQSDVPSSEDYYVARDIAYRRVLNYINANHEFSAAYKFYAPSYGDAYYNMDLFNKNMPNASLAIVNAKMAIRTIHYINKLVQSNNSMIYNLDLLQNMMHKSVGMTHKFKLNNDSYTEYEYNSFPLMPGVAPQYKPLTFFNSMSDFMENMILYIDFLNNIISGDNEVAYQLLPEEDKIVMTLYCSRG